LEIESQFKKKKSRTNLHDKRSKFCQFRFAIIILKQFIQFEIQIRFFVSLTIEYFSFNEFEFPGKLRAKEHL
jgi:hypothetical protein